MEITLRSPIPGDIGWLISMHGHLYSEQFNFDSNFEIDIAKKIISFFDITKQFQCVLGSSHRQ
ncbi:MAG: hypothetical protein ACD_19C00364G0004 [uncultured bacterium]|nr:MAG: hypothetical protein ACD_19C00364G0004 [uncultured bacterium]